MKKFKQFIVEGRDAPLYHFVTVQKLENVLASNMIPAAWTHNLGFFTQKCSGDQKKIKPWIRGNEVKGNSFTRNPRMYNMGARIFRLTVDQRLLAQTHKIFTISADFAANSYYHPREIVNNMHFDRVNYMLGRNPENYIFFSSQWAEEFVVGDIKPLHKYLLEIRLVISVPGTEVMVARTGPGVWKEHVVPYGKKYNIKLVDESNPK